MYINHKKSTPSRGFTLIEMLVVLAILASLAAIAFPLTTSIIDKGKIKETQIRMQEFEAAVNEFNNDNGHLPHAESGYPSSNTISDSDILEIVTILLNKESGDDKMNSTGKKYLLMPDAKNNRTNGILYSDNNKSALGKDGVAMVDAWGTPFEIRIDYKLEGEITEGTTTVKNKTVILISAGPDQKFGGDDDDDIYSWE